MKNDLVEGMCVCVCVISVDRAHRLTDANTSVSERLRSACVEVCVCGWGGCALSITRDHAYRGLRHQELFVSWAGEGGRGCNTEAVCPHRR